MKEEIPDPPNTPKDWELYVQAFFAVVNALFFADDSANIGNLAIAILCMQNLVWMVIIQRRDSVWTQMVLGIHKGYKKVMKSLESRE